MAERSKSSSRTNRGSICAVLTAVSSVLLPLDRPLHAQSEAWRDASQKVTLKNSALEASFQAGMIYSLKNRVTGRSLLSIDRDKLDD